jgi:hypothetical protein
LLNSVHTPYVDAGSGEVVVEADGDVLRVIVGAGVGIWSGVALLQVDASRCGQRVNTGVGSKNILKNRYKILFTD